MNIHMVQMQMEVMLLQASRIGYVLFFPWLQNSQKADLFFCNFIKVLRCRSLLNSLFDRVWLFASGEYAFDLPLGS